MAWFVAYNAFLGVPMGDMKEGENWRGGGFFCVRMQQNVTNYSADCLYLSANSGRTMCTVVQQKHQSLFITSLALDMESQKWTTVFSSLLWAQQSISAFITIQFYRVCALLYLKILRLTSVSQTLRSFYCFAKSYLRFIFLPQVLACLKFFKRY